MADAHDAYADTLAAFAVFARTGAFQTVPIDATRIGTWPGAPTSRSLVYDWREEEVGCFSEVERVEIGGLKKVGLGYGMKKRFDFEDYSKSYPVLRVFQ